jgi:DNA-binding response OmpR family regulator
MSAQKTILVMDDSVIVLETLKAVFEANGYTVRTAENLTELEAARAGGEPDLFVLDVQMPEAFGDDVAQVLRDVRSVKRPIFLFSSLEETVLAARAAEAQVDGWVSKSAGVLALLARVRSALEAGAKP